MAETLRVARLFFVLLAIVATGRWLMGVPPFGLYEPVPYEPKGHAIFSIVILTTYASLFYGAFTRRWRDYRLIQAALLGVTMGLAAQLVILVLTVLSYALGLDTYYNHPIALNATEALPFGEALRVRMAGLLGNPIGSGVVAALGWALGGLVPKR